MDLSYFTISVYKDYHQLGLLNEVSVSTATQQFA